MRAAIYNRCSTEEENQKSALMIQAAESLEVVQKKGWELIWQYVEAQSGTSTRKRLEYQKMITHIEEGRYDVIVIKSIDRLARNAKDWYLFLDCIARNHVKLYLYLEQKFYLPEDALLTGIKAILAEQFSKELSQKMKSAHRRRQERGRGLISPGKCSDLIRWQGIVMCQMRRRRLFSGWPAAMPWKEWDTGGSAIFCMRPVQEAGREKGSARPSGAKCCFRKGPVEP